MKNYKIIAAILQLICAIILVGIAIYYVINENYPYFALFLVAGLIFIGLSIRDIYRWFKAKKNGDNRRD